MTNQPFRQRIHIQEVLGFLGAILHVPGIMALLAILFSIILGEYFAVLPFLLSAALSLGLGQLLFRVWYTPVSTHLWDAMLTAALGWLFCPILAAIPIYLIAIYAPSSTVTAELGTVVNSLFESFSGFTTTGLSLVKSPSKYPAILLLWRSMTSWVGGTGLVVFILFLSQPSRSEHRLYFAEARDENIGETVVDTARIILMFYVGYTILCCGAYYLAGMSLWESLNHSMTTISTGGFTTRETSFADYNPAIKVIGIIFMLVGAISFALHHKVVYLGRVKRLFLDPQHLVFFSFIIVGLIVAYCVSFFLSMPLPFVDFLFNWVSATTTTGFSASSLVPYLPSLKLLLFIGMLIGGPAGSTSGGIKVQRFMDLIEGMYVRVQSITDERERFILKKGALEKDGKPSYGLPMGESAEKLYASGILLTMWIGTLFVGWFFMLLVIPESIALEAFFEMCSAMSNVGLSMGIISASLHTFAKILYILLMWIGRLEVLPVLILLSSFLLKPDKSIMQSNE